jgi:hypothetical protein
MSSPDIFISHATSDLAIAQTIARTIRRTTLQQLNVWFSTDTERAGGIRPGEQWTQTLFSQLQKSSLVLAVMTPNSVGHPWVYFETGFAAAGGAAKIVPVCVGIDPTKLALPMGLYQAYLASSPGGFSNLIVQLCGLCGVHFDEEMAKPLIEQAARDLGGVKFEGASSGAPREPHLTRVIQDHIDKRFFELSGLLNYQNAATAPPQTSYTIGIHTRFPRERREQMLVVTPDMTVQDVLDETYLMLGGLVRPYQYMQTWGLFRMPGLRPLVTIGGGDDHDKPASALFPPNSEWQARRLGAPFTFGQKPKVIEVD